MARVLLAEEGPERLEVEVIRGGVLVYHVAHDESVSDPYFFAGCSIRERDGVAYVGGPRAPRRDWRPDLWGEMLGGEE